MTDNDVLAQGAGQDRQTDVPPSWTVSPSDAVVTRDDILPVDNGGRVSRPVALRIALATGLAIARHRRQQ